MIFLASCNQNCSVVSQLLEGLAACVIINYELCKILCVDVVWFKNWKDFRFCLPFSLATIIQVVLVLGFFL